MKLVIKNQILELVIEALFYPFIFLAIFLFADLYFGWGDEVEILEYLKAAVAFWALGQVYRVILLQLPLALAMKYSASKEKGVTELMSSLINLVSFFSLTYCFNLQLEASQFL